MIGTPLVVTIKDFKHDTVNTVLPKSVQLGEWLTDYLIQLDEKPLSNSIQEFF